MKKTNIKGVLIDHKLDIIIGIVFTFAIILRFYPSFTQPLWLDEKASFYFANKYSFKELLFFFRHDTHPGTYYAIIKFFSLFTQNYITLRVITAVIPQALALSFVFLIAQKKKALILLFLLSFHPLIVNQSWQLRMYNFVFLFTAINLFLYNLWKNNKSKKILFLMFFNLLLGNLFHYSAFIFSLFFALLLISSIKIKIGKKVILFSFFTLLICLQFLIISGFNGASQFHNIYWIPKVTWSYASSIYLTLLGFSSNVYNFNQNILWEKILFVMVGIITFIKIKNFKNKFLNFLIFLPLSLILIYSLISPFAVNIPIINSIFPMISLLHTRAHVPFITAGLFFLSLNIHYSKKLLTIIFITLLAFWGVNNLKVNINSRYSKDETQLFSRLYNSSKLAHNPIFIPTALGFESINKASINSKRLHSIDRSNQLENSYYEESLDHNLIKEEFHNKQIYISEKSLQSNPDNLEYFKDYLKNNCTNKEANIIYSSWECD
jgi:hypothetical protein